MQTTSSPCIAICQTDSVTGYCIGCGRSRTEIGQWIEMTEAERLNLMARLPERFSAFPALAAARQSFDAQMAERLRQRRRNRQR